MDIEQNSADFPVCVVKAWGENTERADGRLRGGGRHGTIGSLAPVISGP